MSWCHVQMLMQPNGYGQDGVDDMKEALTFQV